MNQNKRINKTSKIMILILSLFLLTGCNSQDIDGLKNKLNNFNQNGVQDDYHNNFNQREIGEDISTYFNQETKYFYRQILSSENNCLSGDCPDKNIKTSTTKKECFFCTNYSEVFDDKILVHTSGMHSSNTFSGCNNQDYFAYPGEFEIVEKTKDYIEVIGIGNGNNQRIGDACSTKFSYDYKTNERWIFSKNKLGSETKITISTNTKENKFSGPGWSNPTRGKSPLSIGYIDIKCESPLGFNLNPDIKILAVNGKNISSGITFKPEELNDDKNHKRFKFAGFYNGVFTVQPKCTVFSADVSEVVSDQIFNITISGEESTDFDMSRYGY